MQSASPPSSAPSAETATRPEPGVARGLWEAPPWAIATIGGVLALAALVALLASLGVLRRRTQREARP